MFARIATFEGGDLEEMRRINNELLVNHDPRLPDGVRRVMVLEGERRLVISLFDDREALEASEEQFERLGDDVPESARGRRVGLDCYEVVFDMETVGV